MSKGIASLALLTILAGLGLGNYWFTFGLWPKSWVSFFGFFFASLLVHGLLMVVGGEND